MTLASDNLPLSDASTHDFERDHGRIFNKAAYARQMVLKRVRDLALQFTSVGSQEARGAVQELFKSGGDRKTARGPGGAPEGRTTHF